VLFRTFNTQKTISNLNEKLLWVGRVVCIRRFSRGVQQQLRLQSTFVCVTLSMGFLTANRKCVPFFYYTTITIIVFRKPRSLTPVLNAKSVIEVADETWYEPKREIKCFMKICVLKRLHNIILITSAQ